MMHLSTCERNVEPSRPCICGDVAGERTERARRARELAATAAHALANKHADGFQYSRIALLLETAARLLRGAEAVS